MVIFPIKRENNTAHTLSRIYTFHIRSPILTLDPENKSIYKHPLTTTDTLKYDFTQKLKPGKYELFAYSWEKRGSTQTRDESISFEVKEGHIAILDKVFWERKEWRTKGGKKGISIDK